jgi:hypothetical protein
MKRFNSAKFKLEKLYLDSIDESGNCFIIYHAELEFWFTRVTFSELIFSDIKGIVIDKKTLKKTRKPLINDLLIFYNHLLLVKGSWKRLEYALPQLSFKDAVNNELTWYCHHPKALTEIEYDETSHKGFGYGETLNLTIKPWNLPIEELRWGRFLTENYTIIWVDWKGNYPQHKLFCNGTEYNDSTFESGSIVFGGGVFSLIFKEITVLRKGKLSGIFLKMPWMKIFFNRRILNSTETKYKAKTSLKLNGETKSTGWSLFEIVIWGK